MIFILSLFILAHMCSGHRCPFTPSVILSSDCSLQSALFFPLVTRPLFSSTFCVTVTIYVLTIYTNMRNVRSRRGHDAC